MKKQILNLGKALNKAEQKEINGGVARFCVCDSDCGSGNHCCSGRCYVAYGPGYPTNTCPPQPCNDLDW